MRWPWQARAETREATGGYTSIISALIGAQAAGTTQQASATAATEAVAGALSRAFADARVDGPDDVAEALSPRTLAQIGRDLVRVGESLHVIRMSGGRLRLAPASTWYWEGGSDPADWTCTATVYGPSGSSTWRLPQSSVVFVTWGAPTARPYHGLSPGTWAADTSRLVPRTPSGPWQTKRAGRSPSSCRSRKTAATAPTTARTRLAGSNPISKTRRARRCWSKPQAADGARALSTRRAPTGSSKAWGRCRPRRWSSSRSPLSRGPWRRPVARLPCSTTRTAQANARRCGNGIWASCVRLPGCCQPS